MMKNKIKTYTRSKNKNQVIKHRNIFYFINKILFSDIKSKRKIKKKNRKFLKTERWKRGNFFEIKNKWRKYELKL